MCKRLIFLVSFALVLAFVSNASALTSTTWGNYTLDERWDTAANWSGGTVPTIDSDCWIQGDPNGPTIDSNTTAICGRALGPGFSGDMTMNIVGGSFTVVADGWVIGHREGAGIVNVSDGATVNITGASGVGYLYVGSQGNGTLNVSGNSTIDVNGMLYVSATVSSDFGHINLGPGTITCEDLTGRGDNDMLIDICGGTFIVRNKTGGTIESWVLGGCIIAYGGTGTVIIETTPEGWEKLTAEMGGTIIVDDFDSYADSVDLKGTWVENKAGVVHLEETIAHDGNSMKIVCDGASPYYYEAVRTYGTAQDWTVQDIKAMDVWFRGKSTNDAEQMYVALSDGINSATVVNDDPNAVKSEVWQAWRIDLQDFTDVNMASVEQISIGLGNGSSPAGSGEAYFDDIALFQSRCLDKPAMDKGNLNNDCVIDLKDIAITAGNWLESGMWP
jgi:hypothetical protein